MFVFKVLGHANKPYAGVMYGILNDLFVIPTKVGVQRYRFLLSQE